MMVTKAVLGEFEANVLLDNAEQAKETKEEEPEFINNTTIKVPKKYQHMLEEVDQDGDGYWAYAREGYIFPEMGCRTAHEYTQKDLLAMIRTLQKEQ